MTYEINEQHQTVMIRTSDREWWVNTFSEFTGWNADVRANLREWAERKTTYGELRLTWCVCRDELIERGLIEDQP